MEARAREARARFAEFELDLGAGELRRRGVLVAIPEQPLRVLELLVERAGVVVSRDQLRARLWPADTFVDFEHGLNAAVKRLRDVLGDSAERPRFIDTVPKRGYRFIAPVEGLEPSAPLTEAVPRTAPAPPPARRRRWLPGLIAGILLACAVGAVWWRNRPPELRDERGSLRRLTFDAGLQTDPTFSPDGRRLAFASNRDGNFDIWVQPLEGGDPIQLTNDPADDTQPDWSPDGNWIIFRSERTWVDAASHRSVGGLFRVIVRDGRVERIAASGYYPRVSHDGRYIAFNSSLFASAAFYLASADGSGASRIAGAPSAWATRQDTAMGWHPDGRLTFLNGGVQNLHLRSMAPGSPRLTEHAVAEKVRARSAALGLRVADREPLAWSADGRTLYFVGVVNTLRSIWRVATGDGLTIVAGPDRVTTAGEWDGRPAAAPGGGLAFASSTSARRVWLLDVDASGRKLAGSPRPLTPPEWNVSQPSLSPDGQSLVVHAVPIGAAEQELRLLRTGEATYRRLRRIAQGETVFLTHWSPDGRRLIYGYRFGPPGGRRSSIRLLDLASLQESNVTSDAPYTSADNPSGWTRDGRSVLANGSRYGNGKFALARVPLASAPTAERNASVLVSSSERGLWNATESPDGRWVCYQGSDIIQGRDSVLFVIPAAGGTPRVLAGTGEWDDYPRWAEDGRHIYFVSMRGGRFGLWGVGFDPERGQPIGSPFEITPFSIVQGSIDLSDLAWSTLSVAGSRIVVPLQARTGGIWLMR
jgi:Tol biopolymer transport system component/DNA-binding winged helix-turn-helix (wHTH) protein